MESFRYISRNTVEHLSLHDCCCAKLYRDGTSLVFEMEWMEVLASHPDNPYDKARQSGEGRIVLHGAVIESGELTTGSVRIPADTLGEVRDFEILDFDETASGTGFGLSLYGISVGEPKADFIDMRISYSSSEVMFGSLGEVSWFEPV